MRVDERIIIIIKFDLTNEDTIILSGFFLSKQRHEARSYLFGKETSGESFFVWKTIVMRLMKLICLFAITFPLISIKCVKLRSLHEKRFTCLSTIISCQIRFYIPN
jgi:hypothetical protein